MSETDAVDVSLEEMDKQSHLHPFTSLADHLKTGPKVMLEGQGVMVRDNHGNEYIDSMAGLWCVNVGWGREEIVSAISEQARQLAYYHSFASMANEPAIQLADRLMHIAPGRMSKVFFGNSGSDANDTNVKLVWYYNNLRGKPDKKKIIARRRAYHGVTVASASLTGLDMVHNAFDLPLPNILHTDTPHYYRYAEPGMSEREYSKQLADSLEQLILKEGHATVAAFIAEPVMGAGGVIVPPEGYFEEIQPILRKYDILMIADEVICGFGRCGTWFGSELFGIEPDIVTVAKGLTSGYVPMSGSLISGELWEVLVGGTAEVGAFGHGFTYSAHPLAAAAALANLDIIEKEQLPARAQKVGTYFQQQLRAKIGPHPLVGEVRGVALIAAVELVKDRATKQPFPLDLKIGPRMAKLCMDEGLIT
ncbi:MAG: aminotransferase, partial [Anaerolineae bacterium]|nr:aminotransferase [Anaerolineae bacterium]